MSIMKIGIETVGIGVAALLVGCATEPPVRERSETASAAIRAAGELGAGKVPSASLYLQLAKEESEHAKGMIADGEREHAASYLMRAEADADLAVALAREDADRAEADQAQRRVQEMRKLTP